jgi:hypothetical protein
MLNNSKEVKAKVYGILIESNKNFFISVQYAYCLEDAFNLAKIEFIEQNEGIGNPIYPLVGAKIGLFTIRELDSLEKDIAKIKNISSSSIYNIPEEKNDSSADEIIDKMLNILTEEVPKEMLPLKRIELTKPERKTKVSKTPKEIKNELMKEIIAKNNIELFLANESMFSAAEKKYIKEQLR